VNDNPEDDEDEKEENESFTKFVSVARLISTLVRVKNVWLRGRRIAGIKALTDTVVIVITSEQLRRIVSEDYGVYDEIMSFRSDLLSAHEATTG
jgi:CRP-like cAMP-binding protein